MKAGSQIGQKNITKPELVSDHFNSGNHLFLEMEKPENITISVKLPNGKFVTFAFLDCGQNGEIECVDIHSTVGKNYKYKKTDDDDDDLHFQQHAVGFSREGNTFDTRKALRPTGLITVLLSKTHHSKPI